MTDNPIPEIPAKKKGGRPRGPANVKAKLLRVLKGIWNNKKNRPTDIISAADEYAILMGWKLRSITEDKEAGTIMKIEFSKDGKDMKRPPHNRMIKEVSAIKDVEVTTTTTTTAVPIAEEDKPIEVKFTK